MLLKNNSDRRWGDYNCGNGVIITIEPNSVFEVENPIAAGTLLRNLGAPNWITIADAEVTTVEKVIKKVIKKTKKKTTKKRLDKVLEEIKE